MSVRRTTPEPIASIPELFPQIAALARPTYRLRWIEDESPDPNVSHFGGAIIWPSGERWPFCDIHYQPFVPVLQLLASDVPEIPFYPGADVLQVMWCASKHESVQLRNVKGSGGNGWVRPQLIWRSLDACGKNLLTPGRPTEVHSDHIPKPGRIAAERVLEYPGLDDLPAEMVQQLEDYDGRQFAMKSHPDTWHQEYFAARFYQLYEDQLSTCPGTKIGGYPSWLQRPCYPVCRCSRVMDYLLTITSFEGDSRSFPRWRPRELPEGVDAQHADLTLGRGGAAHFFVCRQCPDWPWEWTTEC